ncbi:ParA family protein [Halopelagius fulvigenes]|uniref:ParA family protein n=1 Tax=Halopelagius fulvigenes TaxID=1198324 RepID=A0ABD5TSU8_9EURY
MSQTRIAVSNQKGGAGKTTTAINVAGALAERGHGVLLVDADPQGHATEGLGYEDEYDTEALSLYDVLIDIAETDRFPELIRHHEEFDVVPAHVQMFKLEGELTTARRREERLSMAFDSLEHEYDFVIVDCPPNLGPLVDNALLACRRVLIPAPTRTTAIRALEILFDQIEILAETFDVSIHPVALVANEVTTDSEAEKMLEWFDDVLGEGVPVFEVRKRVALQRAWNNGVSIFAHPEECDMTGVYDDVAAYLEGLNDE